MPPYVWTLITAACGSVAGEGEGDTSIARDIRGCVEDPKTLIGFYAHPCAGVPLDANDPLHLDTLVRLEVGRPCNAWMMVTIVDAADVPKPPPRPRSERERERDDDPDKLIVY